MASFKRHNADFKASSLADRTATLRSAPAEAGESSASTPAAISKRSSGRGRTTLLVDLILLAVIVLLIVGGVFAYREIRELYAPTWETREVVFRVEMTGIDPAMIKYGQDGRPTMVGHPLWSSDRTDADCLGTVTAVQTVLVSGEDGNNTLNLFLTVEASAHYREGKGYRMGATMLLAGTRGTFLTEGMLAEGTVISMHEKNDESTAETGEGVIPVESGEPDPNAKG
jgi:hypothetical protein